MNKIFNIYIILIIVTVLWFVSSCELMPHKTTSIKTQTKKPNILLLMSDNQSAEHLGCYGDTSIKTPYIDKLAKNGLIFNNAFCSAPSCSPARASMLTGQDIWSLGEAANLWSSFPRVKVYSKLMEESGYHVGIEGKGWGPGDETVTGWEQNPGGVRYYTFEEFFNETEKGQPWMYWYSSRDPHRPYKKEGWKSSGIQLDSIYVPPYLPDNEAVRKDIADYYNEIQRFDEEVGSYIALLKEMGQVENTIIIVCSDNGWQMPRGLANLYDFGTKIPLIISWPKFFPPGRKVDDFINIKDFAPTLLDLANIPIPEEMNAQSFADILTSNKQGIIDPKRDHVIMARERHAFVRRGGLGYPGRAIRTTDYLYIKNYEPNRWPAGDPPLYGDVDAHMLHYEAPTKIYMLENKNSKQVKPLFDLAFSKRPQHELYNLSKDPFQMKNLAEVNEYKPVLKDLSNQLNAYLVKTKDPREIGQLFDWDNAPYFKDRDKKPKPSKKAIQILGLREEYNYLD
tara:strand:+ start:92 stop:1621 length:1530 start_codon:yes stop_codon:yes gene_type:complete